MDAAVIQLITLLIQLAIQAAPAVANEAKVIIAAINGTPPSPEDLANIQSAVLKLQDQADKDAASDSGLTQPQTSPPPGQSG